MSRFEAKNDTGEEFVTMMDTDTTILYGLAGKGFYVDFENDDKYSFK